NGLPTGDFVVNSPTQITVTVPAGATTGIIGVAAAGGVVGSNTLFSIGGAPTITAFSPASGAAGSQVVITGSNFFSVAAVAFNGVPTANYTVNSPTQITVTVPAGATMGVIGVAALGGVAISNDVFTVGSATPTITSFTPTQGTAGSV